MYQTKEKKVYARSTTVPLLFTTYELVVNAGQRWHRRQVTPWMIGFKAGEFTWNRRLALYKAKALRKKQKKQSK